MASFAVAVPGCLQAMAEPNVQEPLTADIERDEDLGYGPVNAKLVNLHS
jgi:hypothetical protein